jgi:hypothetical protein
MVCRVCPDLAGCRQEKDCRAAPQRFDAVTMSAFFEAFGPGCGISPDSPFHTNPLIVVNHAAKDAAEAQGAPRE